jgi:hypothetical protein
MKRSRFTDPQIAFALPIRLLPHRGARGPLQQSLILRVGSRIYHEPINGKMGSCLSLGRKFFP